MKLKKSEALVLVRMLSGIVPYFPNDQDAYASIVEWFLSSCQGIASWTPVEQGREIVRRAGGVERWGGLSLLEEINGALHSELEGEWKPAFSPMDYQAPKCGQCRDLGYWRPPEKNYELCDCAAGGTDFARAFVRVENDRLKLPARVPRQLAARSRREVVEQSEARKELQAGRKPVTQADIDKIVAERKNSKA
jgi:hypothetical protein